MYKRYEFSDWVVEMHHLDTSAEELGAYGPFKRLWDSKRKNNLLPAWSDFELEDFADWYGWICVEDIIPGETYDSQYRLWGTQVTQLLGTDLTGKKTSEYIDVIFSQDDLDTCVEIVRDGVFRTGYGPVYWNKNDILRNIKGYSFIQLPLADNGSDVDKLIDLSLPDSILPFDTIK